jgi:transposase-like protein
MEERRTRRTFDKEFKVSAVKMVLEGGQSMKSVAESCDKLERIRQCR